MNKLLSLALLGSFVALAACGGKSGVVGKWTIDMPAVEKMMADEMRKHMGDLAGPMLAEAKEQKTVAGMKVEVEFKKDNTFQTSMSISAMGESMAASSKGTWQLEGEKLTLTTTEVDGKPQSSPETTTATYKDGGIQIPGPGGQTIVLKRS
jgi:hypothetical protein